jgi:hypothetical protein
MRRAVLGAVLVCLTMAAACDDPESRSTEGIDDDLGVGTGGSAVVERLPESALLAPVAKGQILTVYNGYNNPPPDEPCPSPGLGEHDHCRNQANGLDFKISRPEDTRILAPLPGTVRLLLPYPEGPGCLLLETDATPPVNMNLCHMSEFAVEVKDRVERGQILGWRDPDTIMGAPQPR